jgi:hypothetical protein
MKKCRKKGVVKIIAIVLEICLLLQIVGDIFPIKTEAATTSDWILDKYYNNPYLFVDSINGDNIILVGTHHRKTNEHYYKTDGFTMTATAYNTNATFPASAKNNIIKAPGNSENDGEYVRTTYIISFSDIVGMASSLGITGNQISQNGSIPIYLHVVYDIYNGDDMVVDDVIGVQEMLNAPVKYRLGYTAWDPETVKRIPSYYNMRFDIKPQYTVRVIAVDKDKNVISASPYKTWDVIYNELIPYEVPSDKQNITYNKINYQYSKKWYLSYTDRTNGSKIETDTYSTASVNKKAPDAVPGSTLSICLIYDSINEPYQYDAIAVDSSGKMLQYLKKTPSDTYYGDTKVSYTPASEIITEGGVTYTYQKTWDLWYKDRNEKTYTYYGEHNGEDTAKPSAMPDAEPGSLATFQFSYDKVVETYQYDAIAVDKSGNFLATLKSTPATTYYNDKVSYTPTKTVQVNNKTYTYQNQWVLQYHRYSDGEMTSLGLKAGEAVSKFPMPKAQPNSLATFKFIFDTAAPPVITTAPTPTPELEEIVVPNADSAYMEFTSADNTGIIRADTRGNEKFTVTEGIPATESLYAQVTAKNYLLGYSFVKKVGIKYYPIKVTKNYILKYETDTPDSAGGSKEVEEVVPIIKTVTVPRAYGYWEIVNLECYKIDNALIRNYALPNGSITLIPNYLYYNPPSITVSHSASEDYHIIPPNEVTDGLLLEDEVVEASASDPSARPTIEDEDFTYFALARTGKIKVRSDFVVFNGAIVMNNAVSETEAPDINENAIPQCTSYINNNVLYADNLVIDAVKENGIYASGGTITYTALASVNASKGPQPQYNIYGINNVVIHTPVVCIPSITADNAEHVQLINPDSSSIQLVLDPDSTYSDFNVSISNYGYHTPKLGYYTRDFSKSLRDTAVSYIASSGGLLRNEVQFPFDVYADVGNDKNAVNDDYIKAGTWITIGRGSPRFYLPTWTTEGIYTVNFRTVAANGTNHLTWTEETANTNLYKYVATATLDVEVSGRIYGLTMYDVSDYPIWKEAFRIKDSMTFKKDSSDYADGTNKPTYSQFYSYTYTVGTNDQYGKDTGRNNKYTFPMVNGSHPYYKNQGILKTGYMLRFSLDTIGSMFSDGCFISIKPNFYFVDKDGVNRRAVDLYYSEEIGSIDRELVKVGGPRDSTNVKSYLTGDVYLGIPAAELKNTAALREIKYGTLLGTRGTMFTFSDIRLNYAFRTFVGQSYAAKIKGLNSYSSILSAGKSERDASKSMQRWYGQYYVPNDVHIVAKNYDVLGYADKHGIDYNESFWLTDGYLIVNFTIETIDANGQRRLSYINAANYTNNGNCSMWITEGPVLTKTSNAGPVFNFYAGDIVIYYADRKMSDDYSSGAIY